MGRCFGFFVYMYSMYIITAMYYDNNISILKFCGFFTATLRRYKTIPHVAILIKHTVEIDLLFFARF
jgi:hypothetical protein